MEPAASISSICCRTSLYIAGGIRLGRSLNGVSSVTRIVCLTPLAVPSSVSSLAKHRTTPVKQ